MTFEEQQNALQEYATLIRETCLKKGDDYTGRDRLDNFKQVAYATQTTPERVCLTLIAVKVARLGNLLPKGNDPREILVRNEPVEDSMLDLAVYTQLLMMLKSENDNLKTTSNDELVDAPLRSPYAGRG